MQLFKSYLNNRTQYVRINKTLSKFDILKVGVPQGTVLGPIHFLLYVNDLCSLTEEAKLIMYADDTAIIVAKPTWEETFATANSIINLIYNWINCNLLSLNLNKTAYLTFSNNSRSQPSDLLDIRVFSHTCPQLQLPCTCDFYILKKQTSSKYLGVTIDYGLKWSYHVENLVTKLRKMLYIFYRIRNILNFQLIKQIYTALVESLLTYGIIGWGGIMETHLQPLTIIQKYILKLIINKPRRYSSELTYLDSHSLNIQQLYIKIMSKFIYKRRHSMQTVNVSYLNTKSNSITPLMTVPFRFKLVGQKHVDFLGPKIFNTLPAAMKLAPNMISFKKMLNIWLTPTPRADNYARISYPTLTVLYYILD